MMNRAYRYVTPLLLLAVCIAAPLTYAEDLATESLDEISRKLENPLTSLWSLSFQNNTNINEGDRIDGSEVSNNFFFQPALPVPMGKNDEYVFIARPVFPIVTNPVLSGSVPGGVDGHETGLGDIQILTLFGPSKASGWIWGVGSTVKLPTATDDALGQDKWQAGPAAMLFNINKTWVYGGLVQHWWSFAGDSDAPDRNQTDIQYTIRRSFPNAWTLGMGPTISIDWEADSDNNLTVPIGLGVTKTVRFGSVPTKIRLETHYSIIRPDDYGTEWVFRLQVTPVIKSPFNK